MTELNYRSIVAFLHITVTLQNVYGAYLGKFIGKLSELHHGVSGEVYAIDVRTLHLKDFTYDGQGPAAYFYAGNSRSPGNGGFRLTDENGNPEVIRRYRKENVILTLPEGKTLNNIKWFSVWCEEFTVNFGDVKIPRNFDYPRPRKIDALRGVHGISSDNIVIVDAQTLLILNLSYDGEAPDAKFWVGRGPKPSPQGIRVPDENGKEDPLRRYDRKTVVLTLPGDLTVFDIGHFGIWCEAFTVDFGHIQIPANLNVPPSLKMLGISPQSKLNCEVLYDDLAFEVRWAIAGDSIVLQLVSKLDEREYMSFGISGNDTGTAMIGGDVAVVWVDKETLKGHADDYYLSDKSQCSGRFGSCPDNNLLDQSNNIVPLNGAVVNGYSIVTYQRPLKKSDIYDKEIFTNRSQPIIWAIGPLNQRDEASFHSHWTKNDHFIDFGRQAKWNCPFPETEQPTMKVATPVHQTYKYQQVTDASIEYNESSPTVSNRNRKPQRRRGESNRSVVRQESIDNVAKDSERSLLRTRQNVRKEQNTEKVRSVPLPAPATKKGAWEIPSIQCYEPEDGVFYAQMGPTGGKRGYSAITGHVGWGISWYINGLLIPEINVVRGRTYTFVVEGGSDSEIPAKYHPFYITDDPIGGYEYKTPEERAKIKIFAGVESERDGTVRPTGVGRLCHWTHQGDNEADDYESFGAYQRTLELKCDQGEPGVIQFTPDFDTPDVVYYQCFTHRYLGWKINVLDDCDADPAPSNMHLSVIRKETKEKVNYDELDESPSIRIETRVKAPNTINNVKERNLEVTTPTVLHTDEKQKYDATKNLSLQEILVDLIAPPQLQNNSETVVLNSYNDIPEFMTKMVAPLRFQPLYEIRPMRIPLPLQFQFKKPLIKPVVKNLIALKQFPYRFEEHAVSARPQTRPLYIPLKYVKRTLSNVILERPQSNPNIEIRPEQSSTKKELKTTTDQSYETLISVSPTKIRYKENTIVAVNTGFHPESIVIEGGFKPIITKEIRSRDKKVGEPELKYESEFGIIDIDQKLNRNKISSPSNTRSKNKMPFIKKESRHRRTDMYNDEIADADERVDSYYLPPDDQRTKVIVKIMKPSNIDVAPGTVVSYDGKRVSGASLTPKYSDRHSILKTKSSTATELLKSRPQYGPFQGDLPPLDPHLINKLPSQLQFQRVINRNLETPPSQETTKLVLVSRDQ
ncbi:hypothetical protein FQA39_LY08640 [Lamprigera yunnana]|nr:hypothetical protein FQA39_LY08640 [Lamprigera yunnana]